MKVAFAKFRHENVNGEFIVTIYDVGKGQQVAEADCAQCGEAFKIAGPDRLAFFDFLGRFRIRRGMNLARIRKYCSRSCQDRAAYERKQLKKGDQVEVLKVADCK